LRDEWEELARKAVEREIERVEITQVAPTHAEKVIFLKDLPERVVWRKMGGELTDVIAEEVADRAMDFLDEKEVRGFTFGTGVDDELALVHIRLGLPEEWEKKEVVLEYEPEYPGPVKMVVKYRR